MSNCANMEYEKIVRLIENCECSDDYGNIVGILYFNSDLSQVEAEELFNLNWKRNSEYSCGICDDDWEELVLSDPNLLD